MAKKNRSAFLSYATEDVIFADLLKMKLEAANIQVWMDHDALNAGEEWRNEIDTTIY